MPGSRSSGGRRRGVSAAAPSLGQPAAAARPSIAIARARQHRPRTNLVYRGGTYFIQILYYHHTCSTVRLESVNLLTLRALPDFRWGGRNGNDDRSRSGREFRSAITSFGTLTAAVAQSATPADPRPQGRLRGAQTGQKRAKTRVKEIDLPKKASASAGAAQRSCLRLTHGGCN